MRLIKKDAHPALAVSSLSRVEMNELRSPLTDLLRRIRRKAVSDQRLYLPAVHPKVQTGHLSAIPDG